MVDLIIYKTNDIVEYICIDCGITKQQKYRATRFKNWRCHHCAMVQGHKEGKFRINKTKLTESGKKKISETAKNNWLDAEYRKKWTESRAKTKEKRSQISKEIWSDQERLQKLSESLKTIWQNENYRELKTKQSQELWNNEEYIKKQQDGMNQESVKETISIASIKHWADHREQMIEIINNNLSRDDVKKKMKDVANEFWSSSKSIEAKKRISDFSKSLWANSEYREKMALIRVNQPRISSIQIKLYDFLRSLNIEFFEEGPETAIGYYAFDCMIPRINEKSILIECQGDYWHTLSKSQIRDRSKFTYIDRYFPEYEIMYIWEHEFYTKNRVLDRLQLKLGLKIETIDFNFNNIKITNSIPSKEIKSFLDSYHYIGKDRGGQIFGAYYDNQLIACIVYSNPIRQNTIHNKALELSRFCIHPSYHKKNFASWFISKTINKLNNKHIVAYADQTVGHIGTIYKACGFKLSHIVPADYWYIDKDGYAMHKKTLYSRAIKSSMTETEYSEKFEYLKKYGGQKLCFIKS